MRRKIDRSIKTITMIVKQQHKISPFIHKGYMEFQV
jgi:hypothetical protein